jgi:hypothetical protein
MKEYYFPDNLLEELVLNGCINSDKVEKAKEVIQNNIEKFSVTYWTPTDILNLIDSLEDEDDPTYANVKLTAEECFSILREFYYRQEIDQHSWDILQDIIDTYID